jgi:hypothetical protein
MISETSLNLDAMVEPAIYSPNHLYVPSADFSDDDVKLLQSRANPLTILARLKNGSSLDSTAIDTTMKAIFLYSKGLASTLDVSIEDYSELSMLLERLKNSRLITENEWNRLTVIQMALDGLDIEVNEYGIELTREDIDYASEFCEIIGQVYTRLDKSHRPLKQSWSMSETISQTSSVKDQTNPNATVTSSANQLAGVLPDETSPLTWAFISSQ